MYLSFKPLSAALLLGLGSLALSTQAELTKIGQYTIDDSQEAYDKRIYAYDFAIDSSGTIHLIYARPSSTSNYTDIIYAKKTIGLGWAGGEANSQQVLEQQGKAGSISLNVQVDPTGTVHVAYLVERALADSNGFTHQEWLMYRQIRNGQAGEAVPVASGAFHTRMQLDSNHQPIFVREGEIFQKDGQLLERPFARTLRLYRPTGDNTWAVTELHNALPSLASTAGSSYPYPYYRIADFVYDTARKRFHLTYGDKDADYLRTTYPTCNASHAASCKAVYFPPTTGHNLRYAYSDDGANWVSSVIDSSGTLSENEFWTDLVLNGNGTPYAAMYRYATMPNGIHGGTSNLVGKYDAGANGWSTVAVAGQTSYPGVAHVAGMGPGLAIDSAGGIHGVWDNSPAQPIDADGSNGNTMYRYSPDGLNWKTHQMLLPYSVEGNARVQLFNNQLVVLYLGDYKDARLILGEFTVPAPDANLFEVQPAKRLYAPGETVQFYSRLQGATGGDYYLLAQGPFDKINGQYQTLTTTKLYNFTADGTWKTLSATNQATPFATGSAGISAPAACTSEQQCNYNVPFTQAGFYVAEVSLNSGSSAQGVWGLSVASDKSSGGFNSGAILRENGEFPGFTTFTLTNSEAVNITPYEYTGATSTLTVQIKQQDSAGNRTLVYGPQTVSSGQTQTTQALPAGFYVAEVLSESGSARGRFGISLQGQYFAGDVNVGGWIDSTTGGRGEGFGAFYVGAPQTVAMSLLFGSSYSTIGVQGPLNMTIYSQQADGSRSVYWSTDASKMPQASNSVPAILANAPFTTAVAKSGTPFPYPATYRILSKRTVQQGGSYEASALSPEYATEIHVNDK